MFIWRHQTSRLWCCRCVVYHRSLYWAPLRASKYPACLFYYTNRLSQLDFASSIWSPMNMKLIEKKIEGVQRRATEQIPGMKDLSYSQRLRKLKLSTHHRRIRRDMIEQFKILTGMYNKEACGCFKLWKDVAPRTGSRDQFNHSKYILSRQSHLYGKTRFASGQYIEQFESRSRGEDYEHL